MCDSTEYFSLECSHVFCNECLQLYLIDKFNNNQVEEILCPNSKDCKIPIVSDVIKSLVPQDQFSRYEKFLTRNLVAKNPKCVFCPIPDCESYARLSPDIFSFLLDKFIAEKLENEQINSQINSNNLIINQNIQQENNFPGIIVSEYINDENSEKEQSEFHQLNADINLKASPYNANTGEKAFDKPLDKEAENAFPDNINIIDFTNFLKDQKIILVCEANKHSFCNLCKKYSHGDIDCGKLLEDEYRKIVQNAKNVRKCPQCSFFIEKNLGCNHMSCPNKECNYQFCWICMKKYQNGHYNNPLTPCFGLQYLDQESILIKCPCLTNLKCLLFYILLLIGIPIALSLLPIAPLPAFFIFYTPEQYLNFNNNFAKNLYFFTGFVTFTFLGILLLPLGLVVICIAILMLFSALIFRGIKKLLKKR